MAYSFSPFRKAYEAGVGEAQGCAFCDAALQEQQIRDGQGVAIENEHYRWIVNWYPRFNTHTMIVPKRHLTQLEEETKEEILARHELLCFARQVLLHAFPGSGTEVFLQTGAGSKSTVKHLHWHLFPAMPEDGYRGFEKMGHFTSDTEGMEKVLLFPIEIQLARESLSKFLTDAIEAYRSAKA